MSSERADEGKYSVSVGALGATLRVAPEENESGTAVVEHTLPAGALGAPLHRHSREDEISCVLAGELTVQQGEDVSTAVAGDIVVKPRDVWHAFWNEGSEPVRFLEIIAPGAFAGYFEEVAAVWDGGAPDEATMGRIAGLAADYGVEMDPASAPELMERHGLDR